MQGRWRLILLQVFATDSTRAKRNLASGIGCSDRISDLVNYMKYFLDVPIMLNDCKSFILRTPLDAHIFEYLQNWG